METNNACLRKAMLKNKLNPKMKYALTLFTILFVQLSNAQTPISKIPASKVKDTTAAIKEVTVYGKGLPLRMGEKTSSIQVINMAQNRAMPIRSVNEALSFIPGLDLRQRGVQGIQGDLSIRGGSFEQNLILVNGFKLVDPQTGHHALNLPVLLTNVESIEVFKGSGTRIFGQNAMTGAVNFVTRPKAKQGVNIQLYAGDFGGVGMQATVGAPVGKLHQSFSVGYDKSNGYWYNSDHTNQQYFYDAALPLGKKQMLRALMGYTDRSFGANGYYTAAFPDQWESTQMALAGLSHQITLDHVTLLTKASLRTHKDEFRLKRFEPAFYTNKHWSEVITLEETGKLTTNWGETGFGGEYRLEDLSSSNLGERNRTYASAFLDHTVKLFQKKVILVGNVHYFNVAMNGNTYQKILPGFEFAYHPTDAFKLYGNIGQSYRAPSYTELFYQDPSNVGNPDLQPEYATNAELGATYNVAWGKIGKSDRTKSKLTFDAAVYRRNTNNMIDWIRSTTNTPNPWTPVNLSNVIFTGIESNISYHWSGNKKIRIRELAIGYNYINATHQFIDPLQQTESRYAFSGLRNQLVGRMTVILTKWVNVTAAYRGIERVGGNAYSLVDAKINLNTSRNLTVFLEGNNLLDTDYIEAGFVQMPGRWFKMGMQIKFNK